MVYKVMGSTGNKNICTTLEARTWNTLLSRFLKPMEIDKLYKAPQSNMLSMKQLEVAVGKRRAIVLAKKVLPILPEVNIDGKRRCIFIFNDGVRCCKYTSEGMCGGHMGAVNNITSHFKSQTLRDAYNGFLNDPRKMQLNSEQAMLRLMMAQLISKVNGDQVPMQLIEAITVLCDKIATMTSTMSKINQLTPETVDNILTSVIEIMGDYLPPDKLEEAARKVQALTIADPSAVTAIDPGNVMLIDGEEVTVDTNNPTISIQKRVAMEEADRLRLEIKELELNIECGSDESSDESTNG